MPGTPLCTQELYPAAPLRDESGRCPEVRVIKGDGCFRFVETQVTPQVETLDFSFNYNPDLCAWVFCVFYFGRAGSLLLPEIGRAHV